MCVRERQFHWWARDREVAREPESRCRALLPCPMAHARRHARAVSRACATAARTAKSFWALAPPTGIRERRIKSHSSRAIRVLEGGGHTHLQRVGTGGLSSFVVFISAPQHHNVQKNRENAKTRPP